MNARFIYFITTGPRSKYVKIGVAADPKKRLSDLQPGNPLRLHLVAAVTGSAKDEAILHEKFHEYRFRREWFALEGTLKHLVSSLIKTPTRQCLRAHVEVSEEAEADAAYASKAYRADPKTDSRYWVQRLDASQP